MPGKRMTVGRLAEGLEDLSKRMDASFAQVDQRFERIDQRFDRIDQRFERIDRRFEEHRQEVRLDLEQFATRIETSFKISLERMEAKLDAALDDTREQKRRLDVLEGTNAEEHRLMQAQIDELGANLHGRRGPRRRPS